MPTGISPRPAEPGRDDEREPDQHHAAPEHLREREARGSGVVEEHDDARTDEQHAERQGREERAVMPAALVTPVLVVRPPRLPPRLPPLGPGGRRGPGCVLRPRGRRGRRLGIAGGEVSVASSDSTPDAAAGAGVGGSHPGRGGPAGGGGTGGVKSASGWRRTRTASPAPMRIVAHTTFEPRRKGWMISLNTIASPIPSRTIPTTNPAPRSCRGARASGRVARRSGTRSSRSCRRRCRSRPTRSWRRPRSRG